MELLPCICLQRDRLKLSHISFAEAFVPTCHITELQSSWMQAPPWLSPNQRDRAVLRRGQTSACSEEHLAAQQARWQITAPKSINYPSALLPGTEQEQKAPELLCRSSLRHCLPCQRSHNLILCIFLPPGQTLRSQDPKKEPRPKKGPSQSLTGAETHTEPSTGQGSSRALTNSLLQVCSLAGGGSGQDPWVSEARLEQAADDKEEEDGGNDGDGQGQVAGQEGAAVKR